MLLLPTHVLACGGCGADSRSFIRTVTMADPVSYRLIYTGIQGFIIDEYVRVIGNKWKDDLTGYKASGMFDYDVIKTQIRLSNSVLADYRRLSYADKRRRWWHYSSDIPPAPIYTSGPSRDVIDIGPFRLDNKFKFKIKHYKTDITDNWRFKFRPSVDFSTELPLLKRASAGFVFDYKHHGVTVFRATLSVNLVVKRNIKKSSGELAVLFELPLWGSETVHTNYSQQPKDYLDTEPMPSLFSQRLSEFWMCCSGRILPHDHSGE